MPRKKSHITVKDQFCGAGGSSQGVRQYAEENGGGIEVAVALNHWELAIETHQTNFPDTYHDCTDISASDPRRYPSTDILITSPECRTHTPAGGNNHKQLKKQMDMFKNGKIDPATERSRATMWDVCRFAEYHNYNAIIVENVVEAKTRWELFDVWLLAMHKLGYKHQCVYINSMHHYPTPQSRDRMYIVFWKKGNKAPNLLYTPLAWCRNCEKNINAIQSWKNPLKKYGKYRQQYIYCCPSCGFMVEPYYYAAFNCIDWSDMGTKISDRSKSLSEKTLSRIQYGLDKYCDQPFLFLSSYGEKAHGVTRSITDPHYSQTTSISHGIINPFIVKLEHSQRRNNVKPAHENLSTQSTRQSSMLIQPNVSLSSEVLPTQTTTQGMGVIVPWIIEMNSSGKARSSIERLSTVTADGNHHWLCQPPFFINNKGESMAKEITRPASSVTTRPSLGIVSSNAWKSFLAAYQSTGHCTKHITEETGTIATGDRMSIINYQKPNIDDCFYRMLKPHEIKLAMAFDKDYKILGNSRDQVKQCGNAVTPPVMKWLIQQVVESLK